MGQKLKITKIIIRMNKIIVIVPKKKTLQIMMVNKKIIDNLSNHFNHKINKAFNNYKQIYNKMSNNYYNNNK
jgi:hypothetical protein